LETLQGEGGIHPADQAFITGVRKLCDERDIVLIFDEIQCGMGRTGKMFTYQHYGVTPDVVTTAKALGCGVPVGAFAAKEPFANALVPGDHGTTYGGNPLATQAVCKVFEIFEKEHILAHVNEIAPYLEEQLNAVAKRHADKVNEVRGMGLMQGMELRIPAGDIVKGCLDAGVIVISAGANVIRFVPPLIVEREHIDQMCQVLDKVLAD
jgi:acetylornithine/N-succinyldiaminopimelate aminotransferase